MKLSKVEMQSFKISAKFKDLDKFREFVATKKPDAFESDEELVSFYNSARAEKQEAAKAEAEGSAGAAASAVAAKKEKKAKKEKDPNAEPKPRGFQKTEPDMVVSPEARMIIDSKTLDKSQKFRLLFEMGFKAAQITREFDTHYSFVSNSIKKWVEVKSNPSLYEVNLEDGTFRKIGSTATSSPSRVPQTEAERDYNKALKSIQKLTKKLEELNESLPALKEAAELAKAGVVPNAESVDQTTSTEVAIESKMAEAAAAVEDEDVVEVDLTDDDIAEIEGSSEEVQ